MRLFARQYGISPRIEFGLAFVLVTPFAAWLGRVLRASFRGNAKQDPLALLV